MNDQEYANQSYILVVPEHYEFLPIGSDLKFINSNNEHKIGGFLTRRDETSMSIRYRDSRAPNEFHINIENISRLYRKKTIDDVNLEKLARVVQQIAKNKT